MSDDSQTKLIRSLIPEGSTFYPATRCILSEWPKMATKGQGKGKKPIQKACANQEEMDAFMGKDTSLDDLPTLDD